MSAGSKPGPWRECRLRRAWRRMALIQGHQQALKTRGEPICLDDSFGRARRDRDGVAMVEIRGVIILLPVFCVTTTGKIRHWQARVYGRVSWRAVVRHANKFLIGNNDSRFGQN